MEWVKGQFKTGFKTKLLYIEAEKGVSDMNGVTVITSDTSFMADKRIFLKNGYKIAEEFGKEQLLVKQFREVSLPVFIKTVMDLKKKGDLTC